MLDEDDRMPGSFTPVEADLVLTYGARPGASTAIADIGEDEVIVAFASDTDQLRAALEAVDVEPPPGIGVGEDPVLVLTTGEADGCPVSIHDVLVEGEVIRVVLAERIDGTLVAPGDPLPDVGDCATVSTPRTLGIELPRDVVPVDRVVVEIVNREWGVVDAEFDPGD